MLSGLHSKNSSSN